MDMPKEFYDMVCADIKRLDNVRNLSTEESFELHRQIDARYQACINKWCDGLWGSTNDGTHIAYGRLAQNPQKYVLSNLKMMKAKLETYKYQMNAVQLPKPEVFPRQPTNYISANSQVGNVTNSVNVNVTFEQVRKEVEEMTSLTNEQTQEVLDKISEIEEVVKSKDSKKSKWEKVKPVLTWLADKSCDVGIALLPLLLKIGQ